MIIPWSSFWDRNVLLEALPLLHDWTRSDYVRGAVSGLGLVNMGAGIAELARAWRDRQGGPSGEEQLITPFGGARHG